MYINFDMKPCNFFFSSSHAQQIFRFLKYNLHVTKMCADNAFVHVLFYQRESAHETNAANQMPQYTQFVFQNAKKGAN